MMRTASVDFLAIVFQLVAFGLRTEQSIELLLDMTTQPVCSDLIASALPLPAISSTLPGPS